MYRAPVYHRPPPPIFPLDNDRKIIFLNFRGLNGKAKCCVVRSVISSATPSIVCLSETKMDVVSPVHVLETLGPLFSNFYYLPATGTRGGILLVWRPDRVPLSYPAIGSYHI